MNMQQTASLSKPGELLAQLSAELRLKGYDLYDMKMKQTGGCIALLREKFPYEQDTALVYRSCAIKRKRYIEILPLDLPLSGRSIRTIQQLQEKFPWLIFIGESFNAITPGGPYAWFELIQKSQMQLLVEATRLNLDKLSKKKPVRRIKKKLVEALRDPEVPLQAPTLRQPARFTGIKTPAGREHDKKHRIAEEAKKLYP